jgi:hypothetical protein
MKKGFLLLFAFLFIATFSLSQDKLAQDRGSQTISPGQEKGARTNMIDPWKTIQIQSNATGIFIDDMNADNTVAGLVARGWVVLNEDGGGTTDPFYQGVPLSALPDPGPFDAYEGPDSGYVASNFRGANASGVIDHWLISPEITVQSGDFLKFWHRSPSNNPFDDSIFVHYSTTAGITSADFDQTLGRYLVSENGWAQWVGMFNHTGTVRFAVQYYIFDGGPAGTYSNYIGLDLFEVGTPCLIDEATDPSPTDGAVDIPISGNTAQWINGAGADSICVYFGEVGNLQLIYDGALISSLALASVEPLNYSTTYGWQVVGKNDSCQVPGPVWTFTTEMDPNIVCAFMDDFTQTINWTAVNLNDPCDWGYSNTPDIPGSVWGTPDFPATAESFYAFASSDACGPDTALNAYFTGNFSVDASQYQTVWIEFDSDMEVSGAPVPEDTAAVDVSIDGGLTWTREFFREADAAAEHATVDISNLAGLQGDIRFRLYYYGDFSWHWALDNFAVYLDDFIPPAGVEIIAPDVFALEQNYPNPFNPSTKIRFSIAADSRVTLKIFDILGQEVVTLINGNLSAGSHDIDFNAASAAGGLNSGVYFYRIDATGVNGANFTSVKKMILTK